MLELKPGAQLGQYILTERIGSGGQASVYRARQMSIDRFVAIKVLPEHLSQKTDYLARFDREVRTTARLEHPSILPVYDYGEQDGITYIVMRILDGGNLENLLDEKEKLPPDEALRILQQIGSALDYAHQQNIIHRDVKPSNILFDQRGNAYLADFGIARLTGELVFDTREDGVGFGTPAYMSPEQLRGETIGAEADLYALAIVAYQMLTGEFPFKADTIVNIMLAVLNNPLRKPDTLSDAAYQVLAKATAKDAKARYTTATAFVEALRAALADAQDLDDSLLVGKTASPTITPPASPMPIPTLSSTPAPGINFALVAAVIIGLVVLFALIFSLMANLAPGGISTPELLLVIGVIALVGVGGLVIRSGIVSPKSRPEAKPVIRDEISTKEIAEAEPELDSFDEDEVVADIRLAEKAEYNAPVTPKPVVRFSTLQLGDNLAHYRLEERLDRGERSRVYRAYDERRQHDVALKVMNAYSESSQRVERFKREARLLGRLHHAHIVPFFDYDSVGDMNYIAMPLLTGGSLLNRLEANSGRLLLPEVIEVAKQLAGALDYIHGEQVIHRDLKPNNIMFGAQDNVYLVDFGIAKILEDGEENLKLTAVGQILGTPIYMPPEMWTGMPPVPASDQYMLGALVFQMLTGEPPFMGDTPFVLMMKHVRDSPPPIAMLRPDLSSKIDVVVNKALSKEVANRFPSVRAFATALEQAAYETKTTRSGHIFISYSRADGDYAYKIGDDLKQRGFEVWIDSRIEPSDSWWHSIVEAIDACSAFIVVMTPEAEESRWVHREILLADQRNKPAFPLLLKGKAFPIYIGTQYTDVTNHELPVDMFYRRLTETVKPGG